MKCWLLIMMATIGCGGSKRGATDPAAQAREAERKRIEAMRPESPYEIRASRGYRAPTACGQGPYRIDAATLGARFGERLEINICAPRSLEGDYRLTLGTTKSEPRHFGSRNNSSHCRVTAADAAQRGNASAASGSGASTTSGGTAAAGAAQRGNASAASGSGASAASGSGASAASGSGASTTSGGTAASAAAGAVSSSRGVAVGTDRSATPVALTAVEGTFGDTCPGGMYLTGIVDYGSEMSSGDGVPWTAGTSVVLELWSAEPLHLDGATFIVIQRGVRAGMTAELWASYRDASERHRKIWNAYLDGEVTAGHAEYADMRARTDAPPPSRAEVKPPRPSLHAEWIPGYWQRDREWIWSPGFWRVPDADIVAEQTIEAPVAPPPRRTEAPPVAPVAQTPTTPVGQTPTTPGQTPTTPEPPPPTSIAPPTLPVGPPPGSVTLVWTPGYWSWNGASYVWIEGAWRVPPQRDARWVVPSWKSRRGRFVLVPGGWSVRVGR